MNHIVGQVEADDLESLRYHEAVNDVLFGGAAICPISFEQAVQHVLRRRLFFAHLKAKYDLPFDWTVDIDTGAILRADGEDEEGVSE